MKAHHRQVWCERERCRWSGRQVGRASRDVNVVTRCRQYREKLSAEVHAPTKNRPIYNGCGLSSAARAFTRANVGAVRAGRSASNVRLTTFGSEVGGAGVSSQV